MTDAIQITRKNYWQVNGTNHASQEEAFQDAASQAVATPGSIVQVQPPAYTVTYTAPSATQPPPASPPPSDPPPTGDGTTNIGAWQDGDPIDPPKDA